MLDRLIKCKKHRRALSWLIAFLVVVTVVWSSARGLRSSARAAGLVPRFDVRKPALERLVGMVMTDGLVGLDEPLREARIAMDWTRPESLEALGISRERLDQYRSLMKDQGIALGLEAFRFRRKNVKIEFIVDSYGLAISGAAWGYMYTTNPDTLNGIEVRDIGRVVWSGGENQSTDRTFYQKVGTNWYVFLDVRR